MLAGRDLIKATVPYIRENVFLSWWHLLSTGALLAGSLAVGAMPIFWWARLLSGILSGLLICRLFIIYHDHQHGTILRGSRIADWIMMGYGILLLNPPSTWNDSHNHHHKHNGKIRGASIGSFPVMTVQSYARASKYDRFAYQFSRHPLTIAAAWFTVFFFAMTCVALIKKPRLHIDCAVAVVVHLVLWVVLSIFAPWALLFCFAIPLTVGAALGAYLFYVQHNFPEVDLGDQSEWDYVYAAMNSSSFLDTTRIMHWFTGNIGYHHIHHLNARIPFYRLPEVMKAIPELQTPGRTKLNPWAIFQCFRLKLWDPRQQRMVKFNGKPVGRKRVVAAAVETPVLAEVAGLKPQ